MTARSNRPLAAIAAATLTVLGGMGVANANTDVSVSEQQQVTDEFVYDVTKATFPKFIEDSKQQLMIADFKAEWCGPCKKMDPVLRAEAKKANGKFKVGQIDVDRDRPLAKENKVNAMPTLVAFSQGKEIGRKVGFKDQADLVKWINEMLALAPSTPAPSPSVSPTASPTS